MSITYDLILKYLLSKNETNNFSNKINIMQKSSNFKYFSNLFDDNYFRYGVHNYDDDNNDISFWSSILFCLDKDYIEKNIFEIKNSIEKIKELIESNHSKNKVDNKNISEILKSPSEKYFLELVVNFFEINLLIFDFKDGHIYTAYTDEKYYNPWRVTLFLAKYENFWEPIISNKDKIFSISNDEILKYNILTENILYYDNSIKSFTINDNINEILKKLDLYDNTEDTEDCEILEENKESNETFISYNIISKNLTISKLNKMKKVELKDLLDEINEVTDIKSPKKSDYINLICKTLNINN